MPNGRSHDAASSGGVEQHFFDTGVIPVSRDVPLLPSLRANACAGSQFADRARVTLPRWFDALGSGGYSSGGDAS